MYEIVRPFEEPIRSNLTKRLFRVILCYQFFIFRFIFINFTPPMILQVSDILAYINLGVLVSLYHSRTRIAFTVSICILSVGIFSLGWMGFDFPGQSLQGLFLLVAGLMYTVRGLSSPTRSLNFMCCEVPRASGSGSLGDISPRLEGC